MKLAILTLFIASAYAALNCTAPPVTGVGANIPDHTKCSGSAPYCIRINGNAIPSEAWLDFGCVQCQSDCDCAQGSYCQLASSRAPNFGSCQSYKDAIGRKCVPNTSGVSANTLVAQFGDAFCGVLLSVPNIQTEVPENYTVWTGSCIHGVCRECNSYLLDMSSSNVDKFTNAQGRPNLRCAFGTGSTSGSTPGYAKPRFCQNFNFVEGKGSATAPSFLGAITSMVLVAWFF